MAVVSGVRDSSNILANKFVIDMADTIANLEPDVAPLITLLKRLDVKSAFNQKFEWMEEELLTRKSKTAASVTNSATSFAVTAGDGSLFRVNEIIVCPRTGETMLVTAVSTDTLTITRSWGAVVGTAMNASDEIFILGNASAENSTAPAKLTQNPVAKFNYVQFFRTPFGLTELSANSKMYGGMDKSIQRRFQLIEHKKDINKSFLFGEKALVSLRATTGGLREFITTNVWDIGNYITHAELENNMDDVFKYGSNSKVALCSSLWLSAISMLGSGLLRLQPRDKTFGIKVETFESPHGTLNLVKDIALEGDTYGGYMMVLDLNQKDALGRMIKYRPMQNLDTKLKENIQANDSSTQEDEYQTYAGLELKLEKLHAIFKGLKSI